MKIILRQLNKAIKNEFKSVPKMYRPYYKIELISLLIYLN